MFITILFPIPSSKQLHKSNLYLYLCVNLSHDPCNTDLVATISQSIFYQISIFLILFTCRRAFWNNKNTKLGKLQMNENKYLHLGSKNQTKVTFRYKTTAWTLKLNETQSIGECQNLNWIAQQSNDHVILSRFTQYLVRSHFST